MQGHGFHLQRSRRAGWQRQGQALGRPLGQHFAVRRIGDQRVHPRQPRQCGGVPGRGRRCGRALALFGTQPVPHVAGPVLERLRLERLILERPGLERPGLERPGLVCRLAFSPAGGVRAAVCACGQCRQRVSVQPLGQIGKGIERGGARRHHRLRTRRHGGLPAGGGIGHPVRAVLIRSPNIRPGLIRSATCAMGQIAQELVEPGGHRRGVPRGGVVAVQPGEQRQQQPRIEPGARAHRLPAIEDRFGHAVQRPVHQHLFGHVARQHQRRRPPLRKHAIAPPADIGALRRNPRRRAGQPHIAVPSQMMQKPRAPIRRERGTGAGGPAGIGGQPSARPAGSARTRITQPDIAIPGDPPPPETAGAVLRHGHATPAWNKGGSLWHGWGCVGQGCLTLRQLL